MAGNIIEVNNLVKKFGETVVINECNLSVKEGEIYGFLGANGAGKTTMFKLLTGLLNATSGSIKVFGSKLEQNKLEILNEIGGIIEVPVFYEHLSAHDNLDIHLQYMGKKGVAIYDVLEKVGLQDVKDKPVGKFSLGMRQRLAIARAIIHKPKLLILDEPINGLDPIGIKEMRKLFLNLVNEEGMTIILSSHILTEIQHVADVVGVIVNGKVVEQIKIDDIQKKYKQSLEDYFFELMSGGKRVC